MVIPLLANQNLTPMLSLVSHAWGSCFSKMFLAGVYFFFMSAY